MVGTREEIAIVSDLAAWLNEQVEKSFHNFDPRFWRLMLGSRISDR